MSPLAEIQSITWRELRKSFRSAKGVILAALSIAGGAGCAMFLAWVERVGRVTLRLGQDTGDLQSAQQVFFTQFYDSETADRLADCPHALWMMFIGTIWVAPLLVALMHFDAVSGEVQHRSVRFWTVRIRRSSYMIGKALGGWVVVLAVILGMNVCVWGATAVAGRLPLGDVIGWGARFFAMSIPITAAWCGIATLVGSQPRTPMLSLLLIFATFFGLWLLRVAAGFGDVHWLAYLYPNAYDALLISPRATDVARGLAGTGLIAVGTTTLATVLFSAGDL